MSDEFGPVTEEEIDAARVQLAPAVRERLAMEAAGRAWCARAEAAEASLAAYKSALCAGLSKIYGEVRECPTLEQLPIVLEHLHEMIEQSHTNAAAVTRLTQERDVALEQSQGWKKSAFEVNEKRIAEVYKLQGELERAQSTINDLEQGAEIAAEKLHASEARASEFAIQCSELAADRNRLRDEVEDLQARRNDLSCTAVRQGARIAELERMLCQTDGARLEAAIGRRIAALEERLETVRQAILRPAAPLELQRFGGPQIAFSEGNGPAETFVEFLERTAGERGRVAEWGDIWPGIAHQLTKSPDEMMTPEERAESDRVLWEMAQARRRNAL